VADAPRLYGKTQRKTSTFMVHDEKNEAKPGDIVEIVETRPLSRASAGRSCASSASGGV